MTAKPHRYCPTIGIMGLGSFGCLIVKHLQPYFEVHGFDVRGQPKDPQLADISVSTAAEIGKCDVVIIAVPINSFIDAISAIRSHIRPGSLIIDVASVKSVAVSILTKELPSDVGIVGTHPLFGPHSVPESLKGQRIAICAVRGTRHIEVAAFLKRTFGLNIVFTTPSAHDIEMATVQGLTHLISKVLIQMEPLPYRMTTSSFDMLVRAKEIVRYTTPEVFMAIQEANPYSRQVRRQFLALVTEWVDSIDASASKSTDFL